MRRSHALLFLVFLLSSPTATAEGRLREIRAGVLAHDVDGLWSGTRRETGLDWNAEIIFSQQGLELPLGSLHPNLGLSINDHGDTSKGYAGLLWEVDTRSGLFFDLGVAAAIHDGDRQSRDEDRKQLGSRVLARVSAELGITLRDHHRLMLTFDHVSNANLARPNQGLDTLGIRYGYRFERTSGF